MTRTSVALSALVNLTCLICIVVIIEAIVVVWR